MNKKNKQFLKEILLVTFGTLIMTLGFHFFFLPTGIVTGGISGLSIIFSKVISHSLFIAIASIVLLIVGFIFLGLKFLGKTVLGSLLFPLFASILEIVFPNEDVIVKTFSETPLLFACLFGAILAGIGLGICFKVGATTGGTDIIQKIINKFFHIPLSLCMYVTDGVIVVFSIFDFNEDGTMFLNFERVIYGFIAVYIAGVVIDFVTIGGLSRRTAYIISEKGDQIKQAIFDKIGRGVTECEVTGGFSGNKKKMLICTLNKVEAYKLKDIISAIDNEAFTFISHTKEVLGEW